MIIHEYIIICPKKFQTLKQISFGGKICKKFAEKNITREKVFCAIKYIIDMPDSVNSSLRIGSKVRGTLTNSLFS